MKGESVKKYCFVFIMLAAMAALSGPATAATMYSDIVAWKAAIGSYTETTSLGVADGTEVNGATLADGTALTFDQTLVVATIESGWSTWCCGYTGNVLHSYDTGPWTTETWTLSPVSGFGMYIEPNPFETLNITLTTSSNETLTLAANGDAGAVFFGWVGSGVTGVTITSTADFAVGDFFSAPAASIPEPGTICLSGLGLLAVGAAGLRRKRAPR